MRKLFIYILMLMPMMVCAEDFSVNGILYKILSYQEQTLAVTPVEKGSTPYSGDIVIPSTVEYGNKTWTVSEILDEAFGYNSSITSVKLPNTLKKIGKFAFYNCSNSSPIAIPDGVEFIGGYAFCGVKISGTLPKSLRELGDWAFSGAKMESIIIPKHLKKILAMTFASIEDAPVTFNDSIELIETNAFYQNKTFVNLVIPSSVKRIGSAFQQCTNIETVQLPKGIIEFGSYHSLPKLCSINIPDSITRFQASALANCPLIEDIHWPKFLSTIEASAFKNTGLKIVHFPDKLYTKYYPTNRWGEITGPLEVKDNGRVSIGSNAFADCTSLDSVYITDVVSSIGSSAFGGKTKLKAVVTTKEKPMSINQDVFSADTYLSATLYVPYCTSEEYKKAAAWSNFSSIVELPRTTFTLSYVVDGEIYKTCEIKQNANITPEPSPTKEGYTFSGWSEIPETMPDHDVTVTGTFTINKYKLTYMVDDEVNKTYDVEYGVSITPEAEPTKEGYTFSGWSEIPGTMPAHDVIVEGKFTQSNSTTDPQIISSVEIGGIFYNLDNEKKTAEVTNNPNFYKGDVVIPETIEYNQLKYDVISIMGGDSYSGSNSAFADCIEMTSITLPNSIQEIGYDAFTRCTGLTSIEMPNSIKKIEACAFRGCTNLLSAKLSEKLQILETSLFANCSKLETIIIPESVTQINACVFSGCSKISSISLPQSIESIGYEAFRDCFSLRSVTCYAKKVPQTNIVAFQYLNLESVVVLYVLPELVDDYKETVPWLRFKEILPIPKDSHTLSYIIDGETYRQYEIEEGTEITPEPEPTREGYTFSGWSEIPESMPANDVVVEGAFTINKHELTLNTQPAMPISTTKARLVAIVNEADDDIHFGFEWLRNDAPENMKPYQVSAPLYDGQIIGTLSGLNPDIYYKYRPYYKANDGFLYYGEWVVFQTGDVNVYFEAETHTKDAAEVSEVSAQLAGVWVEGTDDIVEKGFEFWLLSKVKTRAASGEVKTVAVSGNQANITIDGLLAGKEYGYRSYAKTISETTYGEERTFKTLLMGDANNDGYVNDADVNAVVCNIMGQKQTGVSFNKKNADMNGDNKVNMVDLVQIINSIEK